MKYDVRLMKVVEGKLEEVPESDFDKEHYEEQVENWIEQKPEILAENLMIIDRQLRTEEGEKPDLLAIDDEGNLVIFEVKNEKASRNDAQTKAHYVKFAKEHGLIMTGGSDCHQKPIIMGTVAVPSYVADQFRL